MKFKILGLTVLSFCFVGALLPGVASANAADASVATQTTDDTLWVEAEIAADSVASLKIRISAPGKGSARKAFQTCTFTFQGAGKYRCGMDVAEGSIASELHGRWITKVVVDGSVTARSEFTL